MAASNSNWSVRLLCTEEEAVAVSSHFPMHRTILRGIVGGHHEDEIEDSPYVTLELRAADARDAETLAQQHVAFSLKEAGLPQRLLSVVWVAPLSEDQESSHRFLEQAKELFGAEQYDLAIVAAQIHFELQLRLLLERAADREDSRWAKRLVKNLRVAALANDVSKASVQLLLGLDVTESRHWPEFSAHLSRRNAVAHEGHSMGRAEAAASIKVVQGLWTSLAEAERPTTLF